MMSSESVPVGLALGRESTRKGSETQAPPKPHVLLRGLRGLFEAHLSICGEIDCLFRPGADARAVLLSWVVPVFFQAPVGTQECQGEARGFKMSRAFSKPRSNVQEMKQA